MMTFYDRDRSEEVQLVRDVLGSQRVSIARKLPKRFQRWRFTGPLVNFIYRFGDDEHPASFSAQWELPDVNPVSLDALGRVARLARMFGDASERGLRVRLTLPDGKEFEVGVTVVIEADEPVEGKPAAVILTSVVPIADRVLAGIFSFVGRATWTPMTEPSGTMGIADAEFRIHKTTVMRREDWNVEKFHEGVAELMEQLRSEGIEVIARAP
jgi:hypothetical protein